MRETEYRSFLTERNLSERTREHRIRALKRIERAYDIDLDIAFAEDGLTRIVETLIYSAADGRNGRANPSKINVERGDIRAVLAWYKSHLADYIRFCGGVHLTDEDADDSPDRLEVQSTEAALQVFGLERDLQDALRANILQLEDGLKIIDGDIELRVEAGFIDILGRDRDGNAVVIELKAGTSKPESVAQILAYTHISQVRR